MKKTKLSRKAFMESECIFPGGVNSPVRAFKNVNSLPVFIKKGKGAYIYDLDGNKYIDCPLWHEYLFLFHNLF